MTRTIYCVALVLPVLLAGCPRHQPEPGSAGNAAPAGRAQNQRPEAPAAGTPVGYPLKTVPLPAGATATVDVPGLLGRPFMPGTTDWLIPFTYSGGFSKAAADIDRQLAKLSFLRVSGPSTEKDPQYETGQGGKPTLAEGYKTYISKDNKILVKLFYTYRRGEAGKPDFEEYKLQLMSFDKPQGVLPPSKAEPIR